MDHPVEAKRSKMSALEQLKKLTTIVADTGDFESKYISTYLSQCYLVGNKCGGILNKHTHTRNSHKVLSICVYTHGHDIYTNMICKFYRNVITLMTLSVSTFQTRRFTLICRLQIY